MPKHSELTGADLHEPKGIEVATIGQVYIANGSGSGTWQDPLTGIAGLNKFSLTGTFEDVSTASSLFFVVPQKSSLTKITGVLSGPITAADSVVTIYKNSIAQTPTLVVPNAGSGAAVKSSQNYTLAFLEGDVIELRNDGASSGSASYSVSLSFTANS